MKPFALTGEFLANVDGDRVRGLAVRGAGATLASSGLGLMIQVVSTMVLARLLVPRDFGLITMVTTFSLLLTNFGLNGFTEAILQADEINHHLVSNLFWINQGIGLVLTVVFAVSGTMLSRFYHDPQLVPVTAVMSATIMLTSVSVEHLALLKRAMLFSSVSANDVVARLISVMVSVVLGWAGWGYWALVAGAIALAVSTSAGAFFLCRWTPSFPRRVEGTNTLVRFGIQAYGRFTVNYFTRNFDNLLVGWRFGSISLGSYKKAYDLFALSASQSTAPLTNVAVAALSRVKNDRAKYIDHLLSASTVLALVGMGLAAELTLVGKDLIRILLGTGWETSGQIFRYFAPGVGAMLVYPIHGWIHLSLGRADRWFRWGVIEVIVTGLLFLVALPWGAVGIAAAWTTSFWILTLPALMYAGEPIKLKIGPFLRILLEYSFAALLAGSASVFIIRRLPALAGVWGRAGALSHLTMMTVIFITWYCGIILGLHRGLGPFREMARALRDAIPLKRVEKPAMGDEAVMPIIEAPVPVASRRDGPLVSILIPAYNAEEWIADTIRSAMAQSYEPKEIIIVDDGSRDRTLAIAQQFESERIHVFSQMNQGAAAARNHALSRSQGEYIQWLDADDLLGREKIEQQMRVVQQCGDKRVLLSSAFGRFRYRYYRAEFVPTALWCDLSPTEWLVRKLGEGVYMQTATWLISRELTEAAGPWNIEMMGDDDGEYFCRVLLASAGTRFVPEAKVYYRAPWVNTLSYIGQSGAKVDAHWRSMQLHIKYMRLLEDSQRTRAACVRYLQSCFIYFYPERPEIVREVEEVARELGHQVHPPSISWKYAWIRSLFGWDQAKRFQVWLPRLRWSVEKSWDKALFRLENPRTTGLS